MHRARTIKKTLEPKKNEPGREFFNRPVRSARSSIKLKFNFDSPAGFELSLLMQDGLDKKNSKQLFLRNPLILIDAVIDSINCRCTQPDYFIPLFQKKIVQRFIFEFIRAFLRWEFVHKKIKEVTRPDDSRESGEATVVRRSCQSSRRLLDKCIPARDRHISPGTAMPVAHHLMSRGSLGYLSNGTAGVDTSARHDTSRWWRGALSPIRTA